MHANNVNHFNSAPTQAGCGKTATRRVWDISLPMGFAAIARWCVEAFVKQGKTVSLKAV